MREVSNLLLGMLLISILLVSSSGVAFSSNTSSTNTPASSGTINISTPKLKVVASFFPIYEFVKKVGGDKIDASVFYQ